MKTWMYLVLIAGAATLGFTWFLLSGEDTSSPEAPPNIVLVTVDTTRRANLSIYGYSRRTSPNLEAIAGESTVFEQAMAVHTNTAPVHATLMSGLYPTEHGLRRNSGRFDRSKPTLAKALGEKGYETAGFVSSATLRRSTGIDEGFGLYSQENIGRSGLDTLDVVFPWLKLRAADGKPFFLFYHNFDPHFPYNPPDEWTGRFRFDEGKKGPRPELVQSGPRQSSNAQARENIARYDGEIAMADETLGQLVARLKELDLFENTLLLVLADHGETLVERPWAFDHGGRAYDEQVHIPLLVRWPHGENGGLRIQTQVSQIDIFPTMMRAAGLSIPAAARGRPLQGVLSHDADSVPAFGHCRPEPQRVPHITSSLSKDGLVSFVRSGDFKLIEYPASQGTFFSELFHMKSDPGETQNLSTRNPEKLEELKKELAAWRLAVGAQRKPSVVELTPETEAQLRELGYIE